MPKTVATDLLCERGRRTSNRERKTYERARQRELLSTAQQKPRAVKLMNRTERATLEQLLKWRRRADMRRRGVQRRYSILVETPEPTPVTESLINALNIRAALIDGLTDVLDEEINYRGLLTRGEINNLPAKVEPFLIDGLGHTFRFVLPIVPVYRKTNFSRWLRA